MRYVFVFLDGFERWGILLCFVTSLFALCISVTTRYLFQHPLTWPDALTTHLFMLMTFLGASAAVKKEMELKVDALYELFPWARFGLDLFLHLIRLGVGLTLIWAGWNFIQIEIEMDTVTPILNIPNSIIAAMLPLFGFLLVMRSIEALHGVLAERWRRGRQ